MARRTGFDGRGRWRVEVLDGDPEGVRQLLERLMRQVGDGEREPPSDRALARMIDTARRDDGMPTDGFMRALQVRAKQCGLSREERLELAEVILRRDVTTWRGLTLREAQRLMDAMEGFGYIAHLQIEQGRRYRYERCPRAETCPMRA